MLGITCFAWRCVDKACARLSEKEEDKRDKLMPSVNYLQRLGPEHLDQIFRAARWVIDEDADIGFEVRVFVLNNLSYLFGQFSL